MSLRDVKSLYIHVNVLYIHPFMAFGDISETQISKPWRPAINRTQEVRLALRPALKNVLELFVADHLSLTGFSFHASGNRQLNLGPSENIPAAFCRPPLGGLLPVEVWGLDRTCTHTHFHARLLPTFPSLFMRRDQRVCCPFVSAVFAGMCVRLVSFGDYCWEMYTSHVGNISYIKIWHSLIYLIVFLLLFAAFSVTLVGVWCAPTASSVIRALVCVAMCFCIICILLLMPRQRAQ